jgi:hypothetical protein
LWRKGERFGDFNSPGSVLFDALRMIWKLGVEKLDEAVAFLGTGDDGEFVVEDLDAVVPLQADETAFAGLRCDETEDGGRHRWRHQ